MGDGTDGRFYSDQAGRTAFANGDFYVQDTVTNYFNYATNQYHGNSSGDNHFFRGNPLSGTNWNITAAGVITATGGNSGQWNTAYTTANAALPKAGGTMTGALTGTTATFIANAAAGTNALNILGLTNGNGAGITFSDNGSPAASASGQNGYFTYYHGDGQSYGSGNAFVLSSSETTTTILADGKLMYKEGIYSKPSSGTGAGTRKDANWDTAYTYSQVGHLPLSGGTLTGNLIATTANFTGNVVVGNSGTSTSFVVGGNYGKKYWTRGYVVSTSTIGELVNQDGTSLATGGAYRFTAHIDGTGTDQSSRAVFWNENGTWNVNVTGQSGTSSNHIQFLVNGGVPSVKTYHASNYTVRVWHERINLNENAGTDNSEHYFGADAYLSKITDTLSLNSPTTVIGTLNISTGELDIAGLRALSKSSNWLYVNGSNEFTSGVYVGSGMQINGTTRVDGSINFAGANSFTGSDVANWQTAYTVANAALPKAGGTMTGNLILDNGTSTLLNVRCDDGGNAIVRAGGQGQGTGAFEVSQDDGSHGGGMSYNGDGSPAFVSGETSDNITFYRINAGTRSEVFHYAYNADAVTFNGNISVAGLS